MKNLEKQFSAKRFTKQGKQLLILELLSEHIEAHGVPDNLQEAIEEFARNNDVVKAINLVAQDPKKCHDFLILRKNFRMK